MFCFLAGSSNSSTLLGTDDVDKAIAMKQELLDKIDQLGGPEYVAEVRVMKSPVKSSFRVRAGKMNYCGTFFLRR